MKKLNVCPSILQKGYDTYSPAARKALFDGREVSHIFAGPSPDADSPEALDAIRNVGLSWTSLIRCGMPVNGSRGCSF